MNRRSIDLSTTGFVFVTLLLEPFWSCMLQKQIRIRFCLQLVQTGPFYLIISSLTWERFGSFSKLLLEQEFFL